MRPGKWYWWYASTGRKYCPGNYERGKERRKGGKGRGRGEKEEGRGGGGERGRRGRRRGGGREKGGREEEERGRRERRGRPASRWANWSGRKFTEGMGLTTEQKIGLSKVGDKHHDIRMSFVGKVFKSSMVPVEKPKGEPKTDMYPLFPLVEEGNRVTFARTLSANGARK